MFKLTLERQIPLGFIIVLILLLIIGFFAYRSTTSLNSALQWEEHTQQVISNLNDTFTLVLDAETGSRGFIITGNEDYLENVKQAKANAADNINRLRTLVADNPNQAKKLAATEALLNEKLFLINQVNEIRRRQGFNAAIELINTGRSKDLMDEVRVSVAEMKAEEIKLLQQRETDLSANINGTTRMIFLGSLLGIISVGLANFAIFRETGKRRNAESALRNSNKDLENRVRERTSEVTGKNEELQAQIKISEQLEHRRQVALEAGKLGMWTLNPANNKAEMDARSLSLFGFGADEFDGDGKKVFDRIHRDDLPAIEKKFRRTLREKNNFDAEFRVKMSDGSIKWNHCTGQPQLDENGAVTSVVGYCRDVTDDKNHENTLRESEIFVRAILDSLSAHIAVINKDGVIIAVNEAWRQFAAGNCLDNGQGNSTGVGQNYIRVSENAESSDEEAAKITEEFRAVLDGEKNNFSHEYSCHSPDEERWFMLQVSRLQSRDGGAVVSHINITDRKKAEIKMKQSEEFSRSIFENSPDCVKILEIDGKLHSMNTNGLCIMEIDDFRMFAGKSWVEFWEGTDRKLAHSAINSARNGETAHFEGFCYTAKRTPKWWDVSVSPVFGGDGKPVRLISTSRDITERKEAEKEREKLFSSEQAARKEAEIANRLRDEFLATVSHELRAPLNSILGWAKLMQQGKLDEKTYGKAIETIVRNASSQNRLIEDLLDVSRIISGKLRLEIIRILPGAFVEAALESVRPAADAKNITLNIVEDAGISHISGDSNRLQQVVWNLLSNAIKFTPTGGSVTVEVVRANGDVEIRVQDTGAGIKKEFLPHVFDRFRQADASSIRKFGGLGLGLAIVRHITEMHGGTVNVASAGENLGTTFTIKLPVTIGSDEFENVEPLATDDLLQNEMNLSLDGLLILVVDDENDTRQLLVQALTHYGATVATASSAEEALRDVSAKSPDIIVSDIGMPDEDGYSLMRKIRLLPDEKSTIPAVALTAFSRAQDRTRALAAGFQSHVAKPVELEELVTVIASLMGRLQINDGN